MLRPPYKKYSELHIYNLDTPDINIQDNDLIGIWKEGNSVLIFFHKNKDELINKICKNGIKLLFYSSIPYELWESGKHIKSFKIGDILIKPVWEKTKTDNSENVIYIDPSVAFGSGFHPTTKMILESFYKLKKNEKLNSGADFGCGTGLLSIFAAKLGVKKIIAIDNNNLAYEVAKNNVKLNKVNFIEVIKDDIFNQLERKVDFIFANLYYHLLEELLQKEKFWSSKFYFISGFVKEMEKRIEKKIPEFAKIIEKRYKEDWVMFLVRNYKEGIWLDILF